MKSETRLTRFLRRTASAAVVLSAGTATAQNDVKPAQILAFQPKQPGVNVDTPTGAEIERCKVDVSVGDGKSGYLLTGPNGLTLRQFDDTSGDGQIDRYSFYRDGLEVYRDIDSNGDQKIDQFRWYNTEGSRHGVDANGDMKVDRWVRISAAEATREAVKALATGDAAAMAALMLNAEDAKKLGLTRAATEMAVKPQAEVQAAMAEAGVGRNTVWSRFDTTPPMPSVVPAETGFAKDDLVGYANGIVSVDVGGKPDFLIAGDVIQVGDAWKLTAVPRRNSEEVVITDSFFTPTIGGGASAPMTGGGDVTPEQQEILKALNDLPVPPPGSPPKDLIAFNKERVRLLREYISLAKDRRSTEPQWAEVIDIITTGVQGDTYPGGVAELKELESQLSGELKSRATYRRLVAEYSDRIRGVDPNKQGPVNEWFLESLESFVKSNPRAADTAEALFQLGSSYELEGRLKEAGQWYAMAQQDFADTLPGRQAAGAMRRLQLEGEPYTLKGTTLRGKPLDLSKYAGRVVAIVHWASWSQANNDEVEALKRVLTAYQKNGFEIVGVNLDTDPDAAMRFIEENEIPWPNLATEDGFYGNHAVSLGLLTTQQIILLDKSGVVADANANVQELAGLVPKLLLR